MLTTNKDDTELGHGYDDSPVEQNKKYLILSDEERSKGFIRPVRYSYVHIGKKVDLKGGTIEPRTDECNKHNEKFNTKYVAFIKYPESESPVVGRYIEQKELDNINKHIGGCGTGIFYDQSIGRGIRKSKRIFNEIDPYGEENWDES